MDWRLFDPWHIRSDAGYAVSKSGVGDRVRYSAWSPMDAPVDGYPDRRQVRLLGVCEDKGAAVALCVADFARITTI